MHKQISRSQVNKHRCSGDGGGARPLRTAFLFLLTALVTTATCKEAKYNSVSKIAALIDHFQIYTMPESDIPIQTSV